MVIGNWDDPRSPRKREGVAGRPFFKIGKHVYEKLCIIWLSKFNEAGVGNMSTLLEQAIERIKTGDKATGINLLMQELRQNPRNENAWLWMSYCVSDVNKKKDCFKQVLAINLNNEAARRELEKLSSPPTSTLQALTSTPKLPSSIPFPVQQQQVAPVTSPLAASTPPVKEQPVPTAVQLPTPAQQPKQRQQTSSKSSVKSSVNKNVRPQKKKGLSPIIWAPIVVALIGLCGTMITVVLNPDLIATIMGIVSPHPATFTISVHVADPSGSAVRGAKVLFFYPAGDLGQYTDSYGVSTFTVNNVGQGNIRVVVESDNYQVFEKQVFYPVETTVDVRLKEKEATNENVALRTVTEGNKPIANSEIAVSVDGSIYRETTDSDGFAVLSLPFFDSGKIDTRISVNAKGYELKDQFGTLTPGKLQYILLSQNSLTVEIPEIPIFASSLVMLPTEAPLPVSGGIIGSGAEVYQVAGDKGLKTIMLNPDSKPWVDAGVTVYEQKTDAVGNPSLGNRVWAGYGRINLQGEFWVDVQDGVYVSCPEQPGYGWTENGCVYNIQVVTGSQAVAKLQSGRIQVTIVDASGNPWEDVWAEMYTQKQNAVGEQVTSSKAWDGRTNNTGILDAWLTPGKYAVKIDLSGYNWGNLADAKGRADVIANKGETTSILISMGQIVAGLIDSSGSPRQDVWMEIYTQKTDVNGNPVLDAKVWDGRTDNGGLATIGLTQGLYAIKIDGEVIYNVPVTWGVITQFDGKTYQQNK